MNTFEEIVKAIQSGYSVTCYGNKVTLEGESDLWVNNKNGSAILAGYREICAMKICNTK